MNKPMTSSLKIEQLKRKVCLAFPIAGEPSLTVLKRETEGRLQFRAELTLLGCTVEDTNWNDNEELAIDECLKLTNQMTDVVYKMTLFKIKLAQNRKHKERRDILKGEETMRKFNTDDMSRRDSESRRSQSNDEGQKKPLKREISSNRPSKARKQTKSNPSQPTFVENKNETKNNIIYNVTGVIGNPGEFIELYCRGKTIPFPEYLLEKSNGVYLCRATFLNERFESRYAFDMEGAKRDAANLIISYIRYKIDMDNDAEYKNILHRFLSKEKVTDVDPNNNTQKECNEDESAFVKYTECFLTKQMVTKQSLQMENNDVKSVLIDDVPIDDVLVNDALLKNVLVDGMPIDEVLVDGVLNDDVLVDDALSKNVLVEETSISEEDKEKLEIQEIVKSFGIMHSDTFNFMNI